LFSSGVFSKIVSCGERLPPRALEAVPRLRDDGVKIALPERVGERFRREQLQGVRAAIPRLVDGPQQRRQVYLPAPDDRAVGEAAGPVPVVDVDAEDAVPARAEVFQGLLILPDVPDVHEEAERGSVNLGDEPRGVGKRAQHRVGVHVDGIERLQREAYPVVGGAVGQRPVFPECDGVRFAVIPGGGRAGDRDEGRPRRGLAEQRDRLPVQGGALRGRVRLGPEAVGEKGVGPGLHGADRQAGVSDTCQLLRRPCGVQLELADFNGVHAQAGIVLDVLLKAPGPGGELADAKRRLYFGRHGVIVSYFSEM